MEEFLKNNAIWIVTVITGISGIILLLIRLIDISVIKIPIRQGLGKGAENSPPQKPKPQKLPEIWFEKEEKEKEKPKPLPRIWDNETLKA